MLLYKFMGPAGAHKTIKGKAFKVSRLKDLNDPFEWRPGIDNLIPEGKDFAENWLDELVDIWNRKFGIISFTDNPSEPVLWSHYADNHRGVFFEVEVDPSHVRKVVYDDTRPVLDANLAAKPELYESHLTPVAERLIVTKSTGWHYECEYRMFKLLEDVEEFDDSMHFASLSEFTIHRLVLGVRSSHDVSYYQKMLDENDLSHIGVTKATYDINKYKILC